MARHHLVPQMVLRRFADSGGHLAAVARENPSHVVPATVRKAAAQGDFYRIPAKDLEESARDGHDPEIVERALAELESAASPVIAGVLDGTLPIGEEERYRLSQFAAVQLARGWRFRDEIQSLITWHAREQLRITVTSDRVRDHLLSRGSPAADEDVSVFLDGVLNGSWSVVPPRSLVIQKSLQYAIGIVHPRLFSRVLRLIRFHEPSLLTSDSAVGFWAPNSQNPRSAGVANADAVFMPLDRCCALVFTPAERDMILDPVPTVSDSINLAVADSSSRWIYHHPDDNPLARIKLPPPKVLAERIDDVRYGSDNTIRIRGKMVWQ